jgi:succinate dehydrogenase / fumarate reductase iron-sulfur subunit/fumarate reductase iron-sulfur subunit
MALATATRTNPAAAAVRTLHITIRRSDAGAAQAFDVPASDPVTVLDLLREVQQHHDPTLAFRYSCRVAMCGTCAVRVDGRSTLACRAVVPPGYDAIDVAPLAGLPIVRDLVVDMGPFWDEWRRVTPWFVPPAAPAPRVARGSAASEVLDRALDCISCGACYSSCEIARLRNDYLGPAALNRALALIVDPRDSARAERLRTVDTADGVDGCRSIQACTSACPLGLDPSGSIVALRRIRMQTRD